MHKVYAIIVYSNEFMYGDIVMKIFKTATDRLVRYFEKVVMLGKQELYRSSNNSDL